LFDLFRRASRQRSGGAAAVEAALVVTVLLIPLVLGVIRWGDYFWHAQQVDTLAPAVPTGGVAGTFSCTGLKEAVASQIVSVVNGLDPAIGDIAVGDVTVTVVEILPDVGVNVEISIAAPVVGGLASLIELPGGGALVTDFTQRLQDVRLNTSVCR
jgi:hypothetical protein